MQKLAKHAKQLHVLVTAGHSSRSSFGSTLPSCWWTFKEYSTAALSVISPTQKLLLVHERSHTHEQVQEAKKLVEAHSGVSCSSISVGSRQRSPITASTFFGSGAVEHVKELCSAEKFDTVVVDAELSGVQQRNLESAWGCHVLDRVGLIIKIFAQRARTRDARLQVELGSLQYRASRLVRSVDSKTGKRKGFGSSGDGEVVSARERGRSGSTAGGLGGAGGGGETELQLQRRRIGARMKALKRKLDEVRRTRGVQRQGRRRHGYPVVAVVGYTSAGKSSLISALSGQPLEANERLFETLDPVLRRVQLPSGNAILASDTVGFISNLPHSLISAFQATLEEVREADLLVHVLDANCSNVEDQREAVLQVLQELDIPESHLQHRLIEVWNKIDLLPDRDDSPSCPENSSHQSTDNATAEFEENYNFVARSQPDSNDHVASDEPEFKTKTSRGVSDANQHAETSHTQQMAPDLDTHTASEEMRGNQTSSGSNFMQPSVWQRIQKLQKERAGVRPVTVPISTLTREGLPELLHQIDRMVSVRSAIDTLKWQCQRSGPRALSENVKGPAITNPRLRKALPGRLPLMQPQRIDHLEKLNIWQAAYSTLSLSRRQ